MKGTLENVQSSLELKCPQMVDEEKTEVNAYFMLFRKKLVGIQLHNLKEDFMQYAEPGNWLFKSSCTLVKSNNSQNLLSFEDVCKRGKRSLI